MISIIAARSKNNVIGLDGRIPWKIKGEQKQFKELTTGNAVIMGRRTYEEIGRPLPGRLNIVVSNTKEFKDENLVTAKSFREAVRIAGEKDVFVAGGKALFEEALPYAYKLYITEVDTYVDEDGEDVVFFPEFDSSDFYVEVGMKEGGEITYYRTEYTRIL